MLPDSHPARYAEQQATPCDGSSAYPWLQRGLSMEVNPRASGGVVGTPRPAFGLPTA